MPDKNNPKTENKDYRPEEMQVFDWLEMPHDIGKFDTSILIAGYDGARNDSYHRWYPDRITERKVGKFEHFKTQEELEAGRILNQWMLDHGMVIKDEFCFHVLIHISW